MNVTWVVAIWFIPQIFELLSRSWQQVLVGTILERMDLFVFMTIVTIARPLIPTMIKPSKVYRKPTRGNQSNNTTVFTTHRTIPTTWFGRRCFLLNYWPGISLLHQLTQGNLRSFGFLYRVARRICSINSMNFIFKYDEYDDIHCFSCGFDR